MTSKFATAAAVLLLTAGTAAAAPRFVGTYTMTNTEICQALGTRAVPTNKGFIAQGMGTMVASGAKLTFTGAVQTAPMFDNGRDPFERRSFTETRTYRITGTANPYAITLTKPNGRSATFRIRFDEVNAAGVAGYATVLGSFSNGPATTNCVTQMVFVSH